MVGVQLPQGYRATTMGQFTFYPKVPKNSWYSFDQPRKDERLSRPRSHPMDLKTGTLDWESSALTTRSFLHDYFLINLHLRKLLTDFRTPSFSIWSNQDQFFPPSLQFTIKNNKLLKFIFFIYNFKRNKLQFKFYSYCLSFLKVSYPFQVWLCY